MIHWSAESRKYAKLLCKTTEEKPNGLDAAHDERKGNIGLT